MPQSSRIHLQGISALLLSTVGMESAGYAAALVHQCRGVRGPGRDRRVSAGAPPGAVGTAGEFKFKIRRSR